MPDVTISLGEAKAHLSELADRASAGESVVITRRGKAVAQIRGLQSDPKPIDVDVLRALTQRQARRSAETAPGALSTIRGLRDHARY